ncbi:GmrSD restriction endonuclease domain-containing protein [Melissospora conviva]|uniref:GmrSD restriction endonuclease domain-containing protein n=1 Tax=Melissospora conviva TaxID=3388432 RepID=UPI003C22E44B
MTDGTTENPAFRDPRPAAERILQLANRVLTGDILLPRFQRNFVWSRKQVIDLLDSIARNYPIGSMLLWQSRQELASERSIADLEVAPTKPDYPVNYLLDGQQRLSTICGALHWKPGDPDSVWNLAYDLRSGKFVHLETVEGHPAYQVPLRNLSNPSTFFSGLAPLDDELKQRAHRLFDRFTDYLVPVVTLGDMSIQDVAPVFERINSTGTPLTIVDLMRAATWSPTFDLVGAIEEVLEELSPKNFDGIDRKTILRIIAAAAELGFSSEAIDNLRDLKESELQTAVKDASRASQAAADFLATEIGVPGSKALPYVNQFAVLSELFRRIPYPTSAQYREIRKWFWSTTLSTYFGGWNTGQMASDLAAVASFAAGEQGAINVSTVIPTPSVWVNRDFRANSATAKMAALMLGHQGPVDLVNGMKIDVGKSLYWGNDKEFHHFFPRAYLQRKGYKGARARKINAIANIVYLTSWSNIRIKDEAPSEYLLRIEEEVGTPVLRERLQRSLVSEAAYDAAMADDYEAFLAIRSADLHKRALELTGGAAAKVSAQNSAASLLDDDTGDTND